MIRIKRQHFFILLFLFTLFLPITGSKLFAQTQTPTPTPEEEKKNATVILDEIERLEKKVLELQTETKSLSSQIEVMDSQIALTEYRINATKQEIEELNKDIESADNRINNLEGSLDNITKVMMNRIVATYQVGTIQPIQMLLSSNDVTNFITRANYLRIAQAHDKKLIYNTVQARNDYENQKEIFENKKQRVTALEQQLKEYTEQLDQDKENKQRLLEETKGQESTYQRLLAQARAEYQAIQGIVAGNGSEVEVREVEQGERIASIIPGPSCNSGGAHLHFIVRSGGSTLSPFSYLKPIDYTNCSGSSCGSSDGDAFNPSGSWEWPISGPIKMNQGYGTTWAVRNTYVGSIYNFHNGIDISGSSYTVNAVQPGTLYQGSYAGGGGCRLPYVRVKQIDGLDTLYLHVNY